MRLILLLPLLLSLNACATFLTGKTQTVRIETPLAEGATCVATDFLDRQFVLKETPGEITVPKNGSGMIIRCEKDWYEPVEIEVDKKFNPVTLLNGPLQGGVPIIYDFFTGATHYYPETVHIWMRPFFWESEEQKQEWLKAKAEFDRMQQLKDQQEVEKLNPATRLGKKKTLKNIR